jgi:hypothetical protein
LSNREESEPASIKQLNSNITENSNKIQLLENDINSKNLIIENKLKQIKEDETFLEEVSKEKNDYIDLLDNSVFLNGEFSM